MHEQADAGSAAVDPFRITDDIQVQMALVGYIPDAREHGVHVYVYASM